MVARPRGDETSEESAFSGAATGGDGSGSAAEKRPRKRAKRPAASRGAGKGGKARQDNRGSAAQVERIPGGSQPREPADFLNAVGGHDLPSIVRVAEAHGGAAGDTVRQNDILPAVVEVGQWSAPQASRYGGSQRPEPATRLEPVQSLLSRFPQLPPLGKAEAPDLAPEPVAPGSRVQSVNDGRMPPPPQKPARLQPNSLLRLDLQRGAFAAPVRHKLPSVRDKGLPPLANPAVTSPPQRLPPPDRENEEPLPLLRGDEYKPLQPQTAVGASGIGAPGGSLPPLPRTQLSPPAKELRDALKLPPLSALSGPGVSNSALGADAVQPLDGIPSTRPLKAARVRRTGAVDLKS